MPPLIRGQGNEPFRTANPTKAARRGQTVPYDNNGAPTSGNATTLGGQAGSYYLARANHTGTQAKSTISDLADQLSISLYSGGNADFAYTNMIAAAQFFGGSNRNIFRADLSKYTQVRLVTRIRVVGVAGSKIWLAYATATPGATPAAAGFADIGVSQVGIALDPAAVDNFETAWINLAAGARADVYVTLLGSGGDGVADPALGVTLAQFR